jgi:drug/metabolite transporter (DMT)-like permease
MHAYKVDRRRAKWPAEATDGATEIVPLVAFTMATTARGAIAPGSAPTSELKMWRIDALLFLMALIWAVNYSVLKYGTRLVAPLAYNGVRIPLAAVLQVALARVMGLPRIDRADARRLVVLGMLGNGAYQLLFILGVSRTRVATTVLILASGPALVAIIGRLRNNDRLTRHAWGGIALQLLGVLCVVIGTAGSTAGSDSFIGGLLVLSAAVSWAYFSVLVKPLSERIAGLHIGAYTMLGGAIITVTAGIPAMLATSWTTLPTGLYGALLYSSAGAMVIAYLIWYYGVRTIGPVHTSMFSNVQPVLAMAVAWIFLKEFPSRWQIAGAASVMSGLVLARLANREPEAP